MRLYITLILILLFTFGNISCKTTKKDQQSPDPIENTFRIDQPDYDISPYTGMTRKHWIDAAQYLLDGAFKYVHNIDDPMKFPKQLGKSYPKNDSQIPTEKLEGLCRTLFLAAPLLKENPELELNGIRVADYYRHQINNLTNPESPSFIKHRSPKGGPNQILVEFGALSISLFIADEIIWDPLTQDQKDRLAATMLSYGDGPTVNSNWKYFNIFILSFFKSRGYEVNEELLTSYLDQSLKDYRGEGWYNDHPAYDYYSMWAYQLYGILWSEMFGKEHYPAYAKKLSQHFADMQQSYPYLFSKDGKMVMWGRSISYRMASIAPFPFFGTIDNSDVNLGWLRNISSSTILQFLQNPDFLKDGVPTLGFYGAFEPAVQIYSCRGSSYWMGKAFLGLLIPADNPFWKSTENKGPWENEMKQGRVYNHFSDATNLLITDYPNIGGTEVRSWCHEKVADDWQKFRSTENYNRLAYNSEFPWQADGKNGEVAMNYVFKNKKDAWEALRLYSFMKFEKGIYYRDATLETNDNINIKLAEMPIPNGVLRVDKNISNDSIAMRLGHYALPKLADDVIATSRTNGHYKALIIDNGFYQLAMVNLKGWEDIKVITANGLHPQAKASSVINAIANYNPSTDDGIYACLMLWKKSGEKWSDDELFPVKSIDIVSMDKITVNFNDAKNTVNFNFL